ncbi:MAG: hypothetical protein HY505_01685 [Candidatus Yanofskybacteria bacterium]|nr:hypothetical protein [Candidatus Yanofskybacteria bacterium]
MQGLHSPGKGLSLEQGQIFTEHRNAFPEKAPTQIIIAGSSDNGGISPYVTAPLLNTEAFIADWREFYRQVHSMRVEPPRRLPKVVSGFNWGTLAPKGMKPERAYEMAQSMFSCWRWCGNQSLDEVINFDKEARTADKRAYAIFWEDSVEPLERLANVSALQIAECQINTLGLTEMLLNHGWFYWKSGGKHLDIKNSTLCPASRFFDGLVPRVSWIGLCSRLNVDGYDPGDARGGLRSRQAVS